MKIKKEIEKHKDIAKLTKCSQSYMLNFNVSRINIDNYNKRMFLLLNSKI